MISLQIVFDETKKIPENICQTCFDQIESILKFWKTCRYWQGFWEENLIKNSAPDEDIDNLALDLDFIPILNEESENDDEHLPESPETDPETPEINPDDDENKCITRNGFVYYSNAHKFIKTNKNNQFVCKFCQKTFKWRFSAENHIRRHTKETPFNCELCTGKSFKTLTNLLAHKKLTHLGVEYKCKTCGRNFTRKYLLKNHELEHSGAPLIPCEFCDKFFYIKSTLNSHLANFHVDRSFMCDVCPKMFKTKARLREHAVRHTSTPKYDCKKCEKKFHSGQELKTHLKNHLKKLPFNCLSCDMSFNSKRGFALHSKNCKKK